MNIQGEFLISSIKMKYNRYAQTAMEYLIILALAVAIALIVVGVLGGIPSIGSRSGINAQLAQSRTLPIGIDNIAYTTGGVHSVIRNNLPDPVTIMNITLDGKITSFKGVAYPFILKVGQQKKLSGYVASRDGVVDYVINYKTPDNALYSQNFTFNYRLPATDITDGLVGYWSFDDYNSTHVMDLSGNVYDGSIEGDASLINSGVMGKGIDFDGNADYVDIEDNLVAGFTSFSICLWFKSSVQDYTIDRGIIQQLSTGSDPFLMYRSSSEYVDFEITNSVDTVASVRSDTRVNDLDWHHVCGVYNGITVQVYVDVSNTDSTPASLSGAIKTGTGTTPLGIGLGPAVGDYGFIGNVDEVMIWNRALSIYEIQAVYDYGRGS